MDLQKSTHIFQFTHALYDFTVSNH